jgi:hypothetical protein
MPFQHSLGAVAALTLAFVPASASAEVAQSSDSGFVSHNEVLVRASPEQAWDEMLQPANWWNADHTYSGDSRFLVLRATVGGCFCEAIESAADDPDGEIEHMRVIYMRPYSTLRMTGGLGPLQSEAVTGVLTVTLAPEGEMTRITWDYVVGGYMRMSMVELAPLVDQVVGEQLLRLAARLGTKVDPAPRRP